MLKTGLLAFVIKELREVLPPSLFFAIGFNLIVFTTQLILADYLVHFASFIVATMCALVVGKSVLVANALPFLRRFDKTPRSDRFYLRLSSIGRSFSWCASWRS